MTTLNHSGVKGMKKYQHKYGRWQPQAKYANGQPDPKADKKSKDIEDIGKTLSKDELSKITRDKTYKLSKNSVHSDVAYVDGKPASFLELYKDEGYEKGQVSINVATDPEFRGRGLSKKLVKKVLDNPPEGITEIYWETDTDNKASSAVAKSLGFEKAKDYGEGDDNYVYKIKKKEREVREDDEDTFKKLMEEARAKKMKHSDIHKDLVHSALMARFEEEIHHSDTFEHHGVKNMKWYQHIFGDVEKGTKYYEKGNAGGDKPPKKLDQVKEKVKTKAVDATKQTVDTINKAKAKAEAVQAEHKRIRDNKKEADRMAKEEKEHIRKLHNDKAEEMTTEELRERNERMKLIKQYNDAYNAVYPNQKEANRKARRELVNTALKGLAEQAPKQILDYAIGSTEYGKRKMKADIRKKELEVEGKVQDNKGKELDIEKSRINAETNRRSALQTAAKNKLNTATAKRDRHKDVLNRLTAKADVLATKGKSSFLLNRAIKKEQKLLDSLDNAIQKDNEKYANKIEGIYKESIKTNLITLSKQGVPEQEVRVDKKGWFGKEKHTYKKTYQK